VKKIPALAGIFLCDAKARIIFNKYVDFKLAMIAVADFESEINISTIDASELVNLLGNRGTISG